MALTTIGTVAIKLASFLAGHQQAGSGAVLVERPDNTLVIQQANDAGVSKVDGVLRDWEAYTPDPADIPNGPCDAVWVSTDDATITGISADGSVSQTTPALPNKAWVAMSFSRITAVSAGTLYIGWYKK
jgi:hypothetical protein